MHIGAVTSEEFGINKGTLAGSEDLGTNDGACEFKEILDILDKSCEDKREGEESADFLGVNEGAFESSATGVLIH